MLKNNNWIKKRLEDSRNKLGGLYQGPSSTAEVYEIFTVLAHLQMNLFVYLSFCFFFKIPFVS